MHRLGNRPPIFRVSLTLFYLGVTMNRNKAAAFTALNTFAKARVQLIKKLMDAGYRTLEECRPVVIEWACNEVGKKAKLEQKDIDAMYRSNKAGTKLMLNSNHKKYEAVDRKSTRLNSSH